MNEKPLQGTTRSSSAQDAVVAISSAKCIPARSAVGHVEKRDQTERRKTEGHVAVLSNGESKMFLLPFVQCLFSHWASIPTHGFVPAFL